MLLSARLHRRERCLIRTCNNGSAMIPSVHMHVNDICDVAMFCDLQISILHACIVLLM